MQGEFKEQKQTHLHFCMNFPGGNSATFIEDIFSAHTDEAAPTAALLFSVECKCLPNVHSKEEKKDLVMKIA